jgi:phosphate transport system substrate-binding protein
MPFTVSCRLVDALGHAARCRARQRRQLLRLVVGMAGAGLVGMRRAAAEPGVLRLGGTGSGIDALMRLNGALPGEVAALSVVPNLGSAGAIKALVAGALDIGISSRSLTEAELARGLQCHALFRSPLVWATGPDVHVTGLRLETLIDIYAGRLLDWPDGTPIRPILRPENDADTVILRALHPALDRSWPLARQRPGIRIAMTDGEAATDLERIAGAIGTTTLGMIRTGHPSLEALAIDGVRPSVKTLADGTWKPHKSYYLVVPATPPAGAEALRRRLQARTAHEILGRWGLLAGAAA